MSEANPITPPRRAGCLANGLLVLISLAIAFAVGEVGLRVYHRFAPPKVITIDERLGWRATANLRMNIPTTDACGTTESIIIETNDRGFRVYGDPASGRKKILVLGDSYTFAKDVSQSDTFYATLAKSMDAEFFVYGGDGYGTLQEYYILDEYLDEIKPDVIVWQFCINDLFDNSLELNYCSWMSNCRYRKPYCMEDGSIHYVNAGNLPWLRDTTMKYSKLLYSLLIRVNGMLETPMDPAISAEVEIERDGAAHPGFQRAVGITKTLMKRVKTRAGKIPIVAYTSDKQGLYFDTYRSLCQDLDIPFADKVTTAIDAAETSGTCLRASDKAHWNKAAHAIVAKELEPYLREALLSRP